MNSSFIQWVAGIFCLFGFISLTQGANTEARYQAYWDRSDEYNRTQIDHGILDGILRRYVVSSHASGINRFRYGDVSRADRRRLDTYVQGIAAIDPRIHNRAEQKAYWLNLYNALTLQLILDNYPVDSIQNIPAPGGRGPWDRPVVKVAGKQLSLNDIGHRILRPIWRDHKVHFGLACASLGCPNLQPQAFSSANTRDLLKKVGRDFVNHQRGVELKNGQLRVSRIFDWYKGDFAPDDKTLLKVFAHYAEDRTALYLLGFNGQIQYQHDWRINAP